jgi:hypothetical protein
VSDRSRSFLQTEERESLKEQFQRLEETDKEDDIDYEVDRQKKYRIKDKVANEEGFRRSIEQINEDLELLSFFQYYLRDDGGWYDWEATILPQTTVELKRLRDRINHLIE